MRRIDFLPLLLILLVFTISCNDDEGGIPDEAEGTAKFTVSGAETGTLEFNTEVEFTYSIITVSGGEISSLEVYIGNYPTTETALKISIVEQGNPNGFNEQTYNFDPTFDFGFISTYVTADGDAYSISATTTEVNRITFTKISDTRIEGSFEVNLEESFSGAGEKIKITGTFEAVGEAGKI